MKLKTRRICDEFGRGIPYPKEYQKAINRRYPVTKDELETLQQYYREKDNAKS